MNGDPVAAAPAQRAAVVFNPAKVSVQALRSAVAAEERAAGWASSAWFETSRSDDGLAAAVDAARSAPDLILVAGGDGTLRAVAQALAGSGISLGLIPTGTGNLFARELHLPLNDLAASVTSAFDGSDRPVDVGLAVLEREDGTTSDHAFLVMAGIGLDAHMAGHTNERLKRRIGWLAYSDPIARSVVGNKQFDLSYRLDDRPEVTSRAHTVIVGNSGTLTGGMLLLPDAVIDDGRLDAVVFRPGRGSGWTNIGYRLAFNRMLHRTRFGRLLASVTPKSRAIRWAQGTRMSVRFPEPQEIQLDGDTQGPVTAASLSVHHHGLTIRVPRAALEA
ncbi:diacylglycerol/lipid kinase family protein [Plantibacter sp. RU18]|uniref:diacylglycerol/lipid kinase family protein n=1 Tax=Plantibacter sp. RU18 TaxID=3158143 RepID=UPI003D3662A3